MFAADRPIATADQDLLGRAGFARRLAEAVSSWRGNDSLVVALYGTWGIGKSSIKNMVVEALKAYEQPPYIVEYNPWQWSGHDQLSTGFFAEIGRILGRGTDSRKARKREKAWRLYAARLGVPLVVVDSTRRVATWFLGIGGTIALLSQAGASFIPKAAANTAVLIVGALLIALAGILGFFKTLAEQIATAASSRAAMLESKTLGEQKSDLRELLAGLDRPVLVVIDDIDRLRPDEIRLLFQLVKANADFPNLTYLLLFQRDIVEASIQDGTAGDGKEFLEKIVQVGFDVPPVEPGRLHQALFEGLNRILDDKAVAKRFDQKHWQAVFPELRSLFRNLRDVARFLGGFAFHVSLFRRANSFEVNPVDLIAVEALRLFEPGVYAKTRGAKGVLTSAGSAFGSRRDTKPDQAVVQAIIDAASAPRKEAIRGLIKELFPVVSGLFGGPAYGQGYSESWFRGSRVCHEQVFDRYFLLALPANDVSQADLDYLLDNSGDQAAVSDRLMQHAGAGQIEAVLDRLEAYKEQLPRSSIVPFITAIMNVGDLLPARAAGLFVIGADMHATRFVHWALKSFADPKDRAAAFREACLQSSGIVIPLRTVVDQEAKEKSEDHPERYFLSDEDIGVCKQALLARIRSRALLDLERIPFLPWVLYRWKTWGTPSEVEDWVAGLMKRASGVTTLLVQFMNKSTSTPVGGGAVTTHYSIRLSSLREFTGVELVEAALSQLDDRSVGEEQRAAIDAFHKALRREKAGKPEDDWPRDEDDED